jgi:Mg-chelatase subunit ChlD
MKFRLPLYDFLGRVKSYFLVDESDIGGLDMAPKPQPGHMVFVLDMSGSMYNQYVAVKSFLVKLLTLEEYRRE